MARYEANADFRRKLAGRSPGDDYFPHSEYYTGGLVRSENELEYYTPLKKGFILQSKGAHLEKICRRA